MARSTVAVRFTGDVSSLQRSIGQVEGKLGGLKRGLGLLGKAAALGVGAAVAGVGAIGVEAVKSLARIEKIGAQTDAVIRSTGGAAGVTRKHIDNLAGSLEALTSVEAESITEGQNLLLTFTRIQNKAGEGNDVFDQATKAMVDMSVAMGTDMKSASMLVGKALNDPIKGMTALTRAGVQFSDEQKTAIARMVEMGDVAGAQKVILGELNTQFGGSAEALGNTMAGRIERIKHQFGTLSETLAAKLLPTVERLIAWASDNLPGAFARAEVAFARISQVVRHVGEVVSVFVGEKLDQLRKWWDEHGPGVKTAMSDLAGDVHRFLVVPLAAVAGVIVDRVVPAFVAIVRWVAENEGVLRAFGTLIGVWLVGHFVKLGVEATVSAAKQAAAWATTRAAAISSAVAHAAHVAAMIARWVALAVAAAAHAASVAAAWLVTRTAATTAAAAHAAAVTVQTGGWAALATTAKTKAAAIAAAWTAALGPAGAVIAAAETINQLTGNKMNPNNLSLWERLDPRKAFKGMRLGLPKFHDGGVYRAPTPGGEGLAILKDRERVLSPGESRSRERPAIHIDNVTLGNGASVADLAAELTWMWRVAG